MNPQSSSIREVPKRPRRPRHTWRWMGASGNRRITPATSIIVVVGVLFLFNFVNQVVRQAQLEQLREEVRADVARLDAANNDLRQKVRYYESNDYAELVAREQLGYARPGDTVILPTYPDQVISDTASISQTPPMSDTVTLAAPEPNWMRWWRILSGTP